MKTFRYITRMITQTVFTVLLIYFFSADNNFKYHFTINWFMIWLVVSWFCQFYLMRFSKLLVGPDLSVQQLGAKNRLADYKYNHQRDKWVLLMLIRRTMLLTLQKVTPIVSISVL